MVKKQQIVLEYNKLSYEIQKAALADRLKNADNPAARKEIQE